MSSRRPTGSGRGLLFVVSAPSGTGKTTVVERLVQSVPDLAFSRSYTSRGRPGAGETDGVDYNFITPHAFRGHGRGGRLSRVGGRLRQPLRDLRRGCRARCSPRARPGARDRRPGRPAGRRAVPGRSASSCCRRPSSARAPAARPQQGFRRGHAAAAATRRARKSPPSSSTTTWSSTTSSMPCVERLRAIVSAERARLRSMRAAAEEIVTTFVVDDSKLTRGDSSVSIEAVPTRSSS